MSEKESRRQQALSEKDVKALFAVHADRATPPTDRPDYAALFAKDGPNPHEGGDTIQRTFVAEYRFDAASMARYRTEKRFRSVGDVVEKSLGGVPYLEAGTNHDWWWSPITEREFQVPRHATHDIGWSLLKDISKQSGVKF